MLNPPYPATICLAGCHPRPRRLDQTDLVVPETKAMQHIAHALSVVAQVTAVDRDHLAGNVGRRF
jgi:hypothetical protein